MNESFFFFNINLSSKQNANNVQFMQFIFLGAYVYYNFVENVKYMQELDY